MPREPGVVVGEGLSAVGYQVLSDGCRIDVADDIRYRNSRLDLGMLSSHVPAQLWCSAAICVVGRRNPPLFNDDVGFGGAVLESFQDIGRDI